MKIATALFLFLGSTAIAQQPNLGNPVLVDTKMPSVYLRFERVGKRVPVRSGESGEGVWLRLHNNSKAAISVCTESINIGSRVAPLKLANGKNVLGLKDGVETSVCYGVDAREPKPTPAAKGTVSIDPWNPYRQLPLGPGGDLNSISWIPAGGSIVLNLPREHLANEHRISIVFNYDWEVDARNVVHTVYFYASELPKQ